jgi:MFS family permease
MSVAAAGNGSAGGGIVDPAKYRAKVLAISIAGYAFDGMDIIVFALAAPLLLSAWPSLTLVQLGIIATCMLLGMSCGGYIFGPVADKFGRKRALVWCIAFFGITTGLTGFAQDYIQMGALRFLAGLGLGAEWALGSTLLQEFTEPEKRSKMSGFMMLGWPIGYGITILVGYFLTPILGWQVLYYLGATSIILALYIHFAIPESPVWLKMREAKQQGVAAGAPASATVGFGDLLKKENIRSFIYVVVICTSLMCTYWAVNTWLPTILAKERGLSPKAYSTFLMFLQGMAVLSYGIGGFCGQKFGKRPSMAVFSFLAAVTLYLWLGLEWEADNMFYLMGAIAWLTASCIWAILSAYLVEQFPTNIRAVGVAAGFSTGRLIATVVPLAMGAAAQQIGLTTVMTAMAIFYLICMFGVLMLRDSSAHI